MVSKVSHRSSHSLLWPPESVRVIKFRIFLHLLKKTYFLASVLKGKWRIQRMHEVKMPNKNLKGAFLTHLLMMKKKFAHVIPTNICFCELFVFNYKEKEEIRKIISWWHPKSLPYVIFLGNRFSCQYCEFDIC